MKASKSTGEYPVLTVELRPGEDFFAEPGALMYAEIGIDVSTETKGGIARLLSGESPFLARWKNSATTSKKAQFTVPYPGTLLEVNVDKANLIVQRSSFIAATAGVSTKVEIARKLGVGIFGGMGFVMQSLEGRGTAWIHAGGKVVDRQLKKGEKIRVSRDNLVGFDKAVAFDIEMIEDIGSALFGGMGLFWATLQGPGTVYMQTMPLAKFAALVGTHLPRQSGRRDTQRNQQSAKGLKRFMP